MSAMTTAALQMGTAVARTRAAAPGRGHMPSDPTAFAALLAKASIEVGLGMRSHLQLARWVDEAVFVQLASRAIPAVPTRANAVVRVRTVRAQRVGPNDVECAVVVHEAARVRAVAMRLIWLRGRWLVTELEMG